MLQKTKVINMVMRFAASFQRDRASALHGEITDRSHHERKMFRDDHLGLHRVFLQDSKHISETMQYCYFNKGLFVKSGFSSLMMV